MVEILKFFKTGTPPVKEEETLEIIAFMAAAEESKFKGGIPVETEKVMQKARKKAEEEAKKAGARVKEETKKTSDK